ncbi:MAG: 30S ribosomal protein S12 methylthiotransferase RimO [Candidatus Caenarcaniphilales bacterium]|nr:30S ribosomal protein S12 methylthiotransferase RimO [Candidatus Caenarcaniphilales bacterium]
MPATLDQKVSLTTLGCAKNLADSENMLGLLHAAGYQITTSPQQADICIVNTCTFIQASTDQSIDQLLELADQGKKLIVAGCLAQRYKEQLFQEVPQIKAVLGTGDIAQIINAVHWTAQHDDQKSFFQDQAGYIAEADTPRIRLNGGISAYVKISEGCNHKCTFCIIPSLRGKLKSRPIEDIVKEVQSLAQEGVQEVILVSQDSTAYGLDLYKGKWMIGELLERLASETSIPWIRLMYSYPGEVSQSMLKVMNRHPQILNYIDIPLQHSHPETLRRMLRPISSEATISQIRDTIPEISLRTTLIVGFPGETEEEFQHLYDFVKISRFDRLGVFTYSSEDTTPGADLPNQIPLKIKRARQKEILELQSKIAYEKQRALIGKVEDVLIEKRIDQQLIGRTYRDAPEIDGIVRVDLTGSTFNPDSLLGQILPIRFVDSEKYDLIGELHK